MFQVTNIFFVHFGLSPKTEMCTFSTLCLCTVHNKMFLLLVRRLKWKSLFLKKAHFLLSCTVIKNTTWDQRGKYFLFHNYKNKLCEWLLRKPGRKSCTIKGTKATFMRDRTVNQKTFKKLIRMTFDIHYSSDVGSFIFKKKTLEYVWTITVKTECNLK